MRTTLPLIALVLAGCGDPNAPAPELGQATVLVYNPGTEIAHVTARPAVGDIFAATTLGDVPAIASACFVVAAGPHVFLEARIGSYNVRSNPLHFTPDGRYVWTVGDPDVLPEGPECDSI